MDAGALKSFISTSNTDVDFNPVPASALPLGTTIKEYVITGIIGEGGFGIVYAARDTLLQRNVAIKEYMPAAIANRAEMTKINLRSTRHQQTFDAGMQGFIEEARLLAQFKHASLVEILRFWEENGTAYMVMPHYSGKTLRNLLKKKSGPCSERWLKSILAPILDATDLLHNNHIYHRDIAPDNIVVQDNGQPVLLDLGSARRVIAGMQSALTVVVKPGYAPIEQYTEDTANEQGPWTDIYALGAVLYFAITGSAPSASVSRMMRDTLLILTTKDHPHFSENFLNAVNRSLKLRPIERFQSIHEFREALNINTESTGDISFPPLPIKKPIDTEIYDDDQITQILTEEEIDHFKDKLLQTLNGVTDNEISVLPKAKQVSELDQQFNDNVLRQSSENESQPLNSFSDMKELFNQNQPIKKFNKETPKNPTDTQILHSEDIKKQVVLLPTKKITVLALCAISGIGLILAAIIFLERQSSTQGKNGPKLTKINHELKNTSPTVDIKNIVNNNEISNRTSSNYQPEINNIHLTTDTIPFNNFNRTLQDSTSTTDLEQFHLGLSNEESATKALDNKSEYLDEHSLLSHESSTSLNSDIPEQTSPKLNVSEESKKIKTEGESTTETKIEFGTSRLTILPWGEIWVNGQRYGVSPPVRELSLAAGSYEIELRNPGLPTETRTILIKAGENPAIYYNFSGPQLKPKTNDDKVGTAKNMPKPSQSLKENELNAPASEHENSKPKAAEKQKTDIQKIEHKKQVALERILNIKVLPWGEIYLDGKMVGVTPPLHQLKLVPGEHSIDIRHPSFITKTIIIGANDSATETLEHHFK
jgi:non-specific serine/threonine protein kinase